MLDQLSDRSHPRPQRHRPDWCQIIQLLRPRDPNSFLSLDLTWLQLSRIIAASRRPSCPVDEPVEFSLRSAKMIQLPFPMLHELSLRLEANIRS